MLRRREGLRSGTLRLPSGDVMHKERIAELLRSAVSYMEGAVQVARPSYAKGQLQCADRTNAPPYSDMLRGVADEGRQDHVLGVPNAQAYCV